MDTIIQRFLMRAPLLFGVIFIFQFIYIVPSLANNGITSVNSFVEEKQNAVQKQETESVPVRDEPEDSEGVREEDAEEQKTTE